MSGSGRRGGGGDGWFTATRGRSYITRGGGSGGWLGSSSSSTPHLGRGGGWRHWGGRYHHHWRLLSTSCTSSRRRGRSGGAVRGGLEHGLHFPAILHQLFIGGFQGHCKGQVIQCTGEVTQGLFSQPPPPQHLDNLGKELLGHILRGPSGRGGCHAVAHQGLPCMLHTCPLILCPAQLYLCSAQIGQGCSLDSRQARGG